MNQKSANTQQRLLSEGELDALVAPIALYPDALLAQILMASTYPLEVVQAERWAKANKSLKGDKLKHALAKQSWDGSVKAIVATPAGAGSILLVGAAFRFRDRVFSRHSSLAETSRLRCQLLALFGRPTSTDECPILGAKRINS